MIDDDLPIGKAPVAAASLPGGINNLINAYADARVLREMADDDAKAKREREVGIEALLFEAMEQQGLHSVRHDRGLFILNDLAWADVKDRGAARSWAEAEMPEILLLNASQLAVVVRQALKGERDMPPGVEAKFSRRINWRRS